MLFQKEFMPSGNKKLDSLYLFAKNYNFKEFDDLAKKILMESDSRLHGEVFLARAQIKLLCSDESFFDDLLEAHRLLPNGSTMAPLLSIFSPDSPNGFIQFCSEPGKVFDFLENLEKSFPLFKELCGDVGYYFSRQIQAEIEYFSGNFKRALELVEPLYHKLGWKGHYTLATMSAYLLVRCYIANGDSGLVEDVMISVINWAKEAPDACYAKMYSTIREWMNLTTGWSGDLPRFHSTPDGIILPALEARTAAVRKGVANLSSTEQPFADYARLTKRSFHVIRQYYLEIYHAMVYHKYGDYDTAESIMLSAYRLSINSGIVMPFVEYGAQIIPFIQMVREGPYKAEYSKIWLNGIEAKAALYEEKLNIFRGR